MIYLVTGHIELFDNPDYIIIGVEESLSLIRSFSKHIIQFDTETRGLDPHLDAALCFQFGNIEETIQVVVDVETIDPRNYKELLETYFLIGANLLFDCKVCFKFGIIIKKLWDCMIAEQLLYLGYPKFMVGANDEIIEQYCEAVEKFPGRWDKADTKVKKAYLYNNAYEVAEFIYEHSGAGLAALCYRYLGAHMSKEIRSQIATRGLDMEVIKYAANDVKPLYRIMMAQWARLEELDMMKAIEVECNFVPVCAYYEWCGVHMNVPLWEEKMRNDAAKRDAALQKLNKFVVDFGDKRFIHQDYQLDLFNPVTPEPTCNINWKSSKQVIPFLETLGFNCKGIDKKTKEEKDSLEASVLAPQRDVNPEFYDTYLAFSEAQKVCSTYGQNYLNAINPVTDRLHTVFRQLGTDTGRLACGSQSQNVSLAALKGLPLTSPKDPALKCAYPQMQNLPADEITRACFCAEKGNAWISVDYCGQESVLMADFSGDKAMIDVFLKGEDMHSTVAYMIFPSVIPRDTPIKDIKKLFKHERQVAKGPEFCFAYGGNDSTLVAQYGMTPEDAKSIYDNYMSGFPGIADFQAKQKDFVVKNGYILISPVTGHKAFWWDWKVWKKRQASFDREFWDNYREFHKGTGDSIAKKVSTHFKAKTKLEKNSCNSPLQGSGAAIFKIFNRMLFDWVVDNGYFNIVKFCVPVHDEINAECPEEMKQMVSDKIQEVMKDAARPFLHVLELDSDSTISDHWIH